jgi:hypothetical protein
MIEHEEENTTPTHITSSWLTANRSYSTEAVQTLGMPRPVINFLRLDGEPWPRYGVVPDGLNVDNFRHDFDIQQPFHLTFTSN